MPDHPEEEDDKQEPGGEPCNTVPFVPYDNYSMNPAIYVRSR